MRDNSSPYQRGGGNLYAVFFKGIQPVMFTELNTVETSINKDVRVRILSFTLLDPAKAAEHQRNSESHQDYRYCQQYNSDNNR